MIRRVSSPYIILFVLVYTAFYISAAATIIRSPIVEKLKEHRARICYVLTEL